MTGRIYGKEGGEGYEDATKGGGTVLICEYPVNSGRVNPKPEPPV